MSQAETPKVTDLNKVSYALSKMDKGLESEWNNYALLRLLSEYKPKTWEMFQKWAKSSAFSGGFSFPDTRSYLSLTLGDRDASEYLADFKAFEDGFDLEQFRADLYVLGLPDDLQFDVMISLDWDATREEIHARTMRLMEVRRDLDLPTNLVSDQEDAVVKKRRRRGRSRGSRKRRAQASDNGNAGSSQCSYCEKYGHTEVECRAKKREERQIKIILERISSQTE
ncbi:hypothetical protein BZA70DRAFT_265001 [Myxozyma melibiosi]|uniref:Retrotransposon gag domain-containing protein n=1 Tax=Myxozyma melibiosi TaxID=54550 RepID=A0ABR1FCZ1_9ASCO